MKCTVRTTQIHLVSRKYETPRPNLEVGMV